MEAYLDAERGKVLKASISARVSGAGGGTPGADGGYYIPSVTDGNLTWTPSKPDMPEVAPAYIKGKDGKDGKTGPAGAPGYTPVRGTDYWTEEDQEQMVQDVLAALPVYQLENGKLTII